MSRLVGNRSTGTMLGAALRLRPRGRGPSLLSRGLAPLLCIALALCATLLRAETPLYQEEAYDQITLNAANDNAVIKVEPLETSIRNAILRGINFVKKPDGLTVHPLAGAAADKDYKILWQDIAKIELFEQLVLNRAGELTSQGRFDEAYDYLTYLDHNSHGLRGLAKTTEDFLLAEANAAYRKGQYDGALALLRELHRRSPKRPGLDRAVGVATDKLVEQLVAAKNYSPARILVHNLALDFPGSQVAASWRQRWRDEGTPLLVEAQRAREAKQWGKAAEISRQLTAMCPELPGVRELAETVHRNYARVVVGVTATTTDFANCRLDDWPSRRDRRLLYRTLTEFAGPSTEGGKYDCPVGEISSEELGRRLKIHLKPDVRWAKGDSTLSGAALARFLLLAATPNSPACEPEWASLMTAATVDNVYDVNVDLRRSHVRPEALLQLPLTPPSDQGDANRAAQPPTNGPLVIQSQTPQQTVFGANLRYFAHEQGQPMELVERRFDTAAQAIAALRHGDVQVVDRIDPWMVQSLRNDRRLVVQPYTMPLIHCLIANVHRPLMSDRTFRRGLAYGIDCQAIVKQLFGGVDVPGCVPTSSPFPLGIGAGDPMGYASDEIIEPRRYDPQLCIALTGAANWSYHNALAAKKGEQQSAGDKKAAPAVEKADPKPAEGDNKAEAEKRKKKRKGPPLPKLTLAYPPDEIARQSCQAIKKQLEWAGLSVTLRPLQTPLPTRIPDDVDLLYVELATWEPVVDANRLFGAEGLAGDAGPYMTLALRQLDQAVEWDQVRDCLHRVHRIAYNDVTVIPLWQFIEHFAYRKELHGVGPRVVTLYQNIEKWRPSFQYPAEK
ncbi:MAG: ABC transporter substrate-binding protein [Thermoguttaceae bacterium]